MPLTIQLPAELEHNLRREYGNLDQVAKEALLVELYRQDKLAHWELSQAMGLDRFETEALLKQHNVTEDLQSTEEYDAALSRLRELTTE